MKPFRVVSYFEDEARAKSFHQITKHMSDTSELLWSVDDTGPEVISSLGRRRSLPSQTAAGKFLLGLLSERGGKAKRADLMESFEKAGRSRNSVSPILSGMRHEGLVRFDRKTAEIVARAKV